MATTMFYLGQDVPLLSAAVVDDNGNPAAATVTITVTDPTGAVVTGTTAPVQVTGSSTYTAVVPSPQVPGIYSVRWAAVGSGFLWTYEDQFTVQAASVRQIVDLASVKKELNFQPNDTSQDDELRRFILAATEQITGMCVPMLQTQRTQWFDGGKTTLVPDYVPVASVQSVTEYYGLSAFPVTEQALGGQMNAFGFTVDYLTGQITRRTFGGQAALWGAGQKNVKVVYTSGTGQVPYSAQQAALELIRVRWQQSQQGRGGATLDSGGDVPLRIGMPYAVVEILEAANLLRVPAIA